MLGEVSRQRWSFELMEKTYGLNLKENSSLTVQFRMWAGRYGKESEVINDDVDRWLFEMFLQYRELVPVKIAAPQLGLDTPDLVQILNVMTDSGCISSSERDGVFLEVISKNVIRDLPGRLPSFPRKTWESRSSYVRAFHEAVAQDLKLSVVLLQCSASERLKDPEPEVSMERDIITNEPIGLQYQDWMDFKQPITLKPDACSIFTLVQYSEILDDYRMSKGKAELVEKVKATLEAERQ
jgi:hypothetical protein